MAERKTGKQTSTQSAAAPLDPPVKKKTEPGRSLTREPATAYIATPGARHVRLVDEDGNELSADELFEKPDTPQTRWVTRQRVYQVYKHPNSTTEVTQLLHPKGVRIPLEEAQELMKRIGAHSG